MTAGAALPQGRAFALGRGGAAAFCGAGGPEAPCPTKPKQGRGQGPRPCFVRAVRARRPVRNAGIFPPSKRSIHRPFPVPKTYSQNEPAAPDERRAGIIRQKTGKVFQQVFPRFFKSGRGAEPSAASGGKSEAEAQ